MSKVWTFEDIPLRGFFRPRWSQNEVHPIQSVNMAWAQLTPPGLVPAVIINGQPWTADQLPNGFEWNWTGKGEFWECAGEVPPMPVAVDASVQLSKDLVARLDQTVKETLQRALDVAAEQQANLEGLGAKLEELRAEFAALKERKTADEARAGAAAPEPTKPEAPPQGGAGKGAQGKPGGK